MISAEIRQELDGANFISSLLMLRTEKSRGAGA